MAYATIEDVRARYTGAFNEDMANALLEDAAVTIDAYNKNASDEIKKVISCRMVIRAIGANGEADMPIGATQGTMSALGYSQTWTIGSNGAIGELYLSKMDKKLLGVSNKIGSHSPLEDL